MGEQSQQTFKKADRLSF